MSVALILVLVAFGVLAGVTAGLLGVGGGIVMVPVLTLIAGYSQHRSEATSLLVILPTAIIGSAVLRRKGVGDLPRGLAIGAFGALGGFAGAQAALALGSDTLRLIFAIFLAVVGLRMCWAALRRRRSAASA